MHNERIGYKSGLRVKNMKLLERTNVGNNLGLWTHQVARTDSAKHRLDVARIVCETCATNIVLAYQTVAWQIGVDGAAMFNKIIDLSKIYRLF